MFNKISNKISSRKALRVCALLLALVGILGLCACTGSNPTVVPGSGGNSTPGSTPQDSGSDPSGQISGSPSDSSAVVSNPSQVSRDPSSKTSESPTPPVVFETEQVSAKNVRHVFTHCLINDPKKGCSTANGPLDADCLTVSEFKALLESLYKNNFCLINIHDMYVVDENGKAKLADTVTVNKGKKPLVISIDDVTYDPRKKGSGMVDRLVIENGTIMGCYDNADGTMTLTDGEVFPIVEQFIKEHPDFSYNGNKVTLALTGFAGILGYRTDEQYAGTYDVAAERQKAQEVVNWLKANGYNFACHSYSHSNYTTCSLSRVERDVEMWNRNVKPLIGETKVFVYPYGAFTYQNTEKHNLLLKEGFVMFCGTSQLNTIWDGSQPKEGGGSVKNTGTIYLERFTVTGFTVRTYGSEQTYYNYYFDYFKKAGNSEEVAKQKAQNYLEKNYPIARKNSLEYYVPEEIYDHNNRYYKIV